MMLGIAILASSCGSNEELQPSASYAQIVMVDTIDYVYTWDTVYYNRLISIIDGEATSLDYNLSVSFNEEFIEIVDNDAEIKSNIIFIGRWTNKCTFVIDNNFGIIIVNLKTGFMTINYKDGKKEIYTH